MKYLKIIFLVVIVLFFACCKDEDAPNQNEDPPSVDPEPVLVKEYEVEFYVDGVVVSSQIVKEGESAIRPDDPEISGMVFIGWDTDFTNVQSNLYINAEFEKLIIKHTATFYVNGEVYKVVEVEEGKSLVYPADPEVLHFEFKGWDRPMYTRISEDVVITAVLEQTEFLVKFYLDEKLISENYVTKGELPSEPALSIPEGREFVGWDKEIGEVMEDSEYFGTTDVDRTNERMVIGSAVSEIEAYFLSLTYPLVDGDVLTLEENINDVSISWESSNNQVVLETGRVKQPYTAKKEYEVDLTATMTYNGYKMKHIFTVTVKRGYKDLSKGIAAVYNSGSSYLSEAALKTYDIVYYAFINPNMTTGKLTNAYAAISIINGYKDKLHAEGGRVMASLVAQNANANTFRKICDDPEKLETLVSDLAKFVVDNDLDGIDVDWETPGDDGAKSYTKLMKALYEKLKSIDPNYLVTSAIGAGPWQYNKYDLVNSAKYHDYINMMSYDMQSGTTCTFQNALYYKAGAVAGNCSIDDTIRIYNSVGVKNSQIIVGVPFYGRRSPDAKYLGGSCGSNTAMGQETISGYIKNSNYQYIFDEDCKVPYLLNTVDGYFVTFEDAQSIDYKYQYIAEKGLAGMMAWQIRQDYNDKLTIAMKNAKSKYMG